VIRTGSTVKGMGLRVNRTEFRDRIDPRRPNQPEPETPEDNPPGTLEEVAPEDPKRPMLNDRSAEPSLPTGDMSADTPTSLSEQKEIPADAPVNSYVDPDMPGGVPLVPGHPDTPVPPMIEDEVPETWDEKPLEDLPEEGQKEPLPPS
jgi:hypothetical protein